MQLKNMQETSTKSESSWHSTMLYCEATCKTDTFMHINHMSEAKCKTENLPAAGNTWILVQEETEK